MKRKKVISFIFILLFICVLFFIIKARLGNEKSRISDVVKKGKLEIKVMASGELKAEKYKSINAPNDELKKNEIWEISVAWLIPEGTVVDSGQVVAELDRTKITEKLNEIEKSIQVKNDELENAKLDTSIELSSIRDELLNKLYNIEEMKFTVEQSMYESPAVIKQAKNQLEKAEREYQQTIKNQKLKKKKTEALINQQRWEIQQLNEKRNGILNLLQELVIKSPGKGMIAYYTGMDGQRVETGSAVQLWRDPVIATLPNFTSMKSNMYVNEIDVSRIKTGQKVNVKIDAFPDKNFEGTVNFLANIGEQLPNSEAKVFNVVVNLKNTDPVLKPGMTTSNIIYTSVYDDVLYIPIEAVYFTETDTFVYKSKGLREIKQKVNVGDMNENYIIVKKGLNEDDKIYLYR